MSNFKYLLFCIPFLISLYSNSQNTVSFSHSPGFYSESFLLSIISSDSIYYTTNGSIPTTASALYTTPFLIKSRKGEANIISTIPTTPDSEKFVWKMPITEVFKSTVVRACSFSNGTRTSPIYSCTYFVDDSMTDRYSLPILSIITDSLNLFDFDSGIYVPGKDYDASNPSYSGNYCLKGDEWERRAHIELFETSGTLALSQDIGIRINGYYTRKHPQKSLRLYARDTYGNDYFQYPFFNERDQEKYKRIILRTASSDWGFSMFKDAFIHHIVFKKKMNIGVQLSNAAIIFINGEYWGIHTIRERQDKYYLRDNYNATIDSLDLLENNIGLYGSAYGVEEGDSTAYKKFIDYIQSYDLSSYQAYNYIETQMNIDNYIDYQIAEIYFGNYDWPGNNITFWKEKNDTAKWKWLLNDLDGAMNKYDTDSYAHAIQQGNQEWPNPDWSTFLFRSLLQNESFLQKFLTRFDYLLNHVFIISDLVNEIDSFKSVYANEIIEHINRWGYPESYEKWISSIDQLEEFVTNRNSFLYDLLSVPTESDSTFIVYPNPCEDKIYFKSLYDCSFRIFDSSGKLVINKDYIVDPKENILLSIDISFLSSGIYLVEIGTSKHKWESKLLVVPKK